MWQESLLTPRYCALKGNKKFFEKSLKKVLTKRNVCGIIIGRLEKGQQTNLEN